VRSFVIDGGAEVEGQLLFFECSEKVVPRIPPVRSSPVPIRYWMFSDVAGRESHDWAESAFGGFSFIVPFFPVVTDASTT